LGAAITPVDNSKVARKTAGLTNNDFQNVDDIWVVFLTLFGNFTLKIWGASNRLV
jgi:hypothetical protein